MCWVDRRGTAALEVGFWVAGLDRDVVVDRVRAREAAAAWPWVVAVAWWRQRRWRRWCKLLRLGALVGKHGIAHGAAIGGCGFEASEAEALEPHLAADDQSRSFELAGAIVERLELFMPIWVVAIEVECLAGQRGPAALVVLAEAFGDLEACHGELLLYAGPSRTIRQG